MNQDLAESESRSRTERITGRFVDRHEQHADGMIGLLADSP